MIFQFVASWLCALFGWCGEGECREMPRPEASYVVCSYPVSSINVRLFLKDQSGKPYGYLGRLEDDLRHVPLMLMNGGMYHDDLNAVGLFVVNGEEKKNLSTKDGWGNFHLLPNGVFWGKDGKLAVTESLRFKRENIKPDFATQSGPMLVIDGKLHPRFLKESDSLKIRNGVGLSRDRTTIHFAISKTAVNFWNFGKLFQNELKAHNALFLDGTVSAIKTGNYSRGGWRAIGPIIGVFGK